MISDSGIQVGDYSKSEEICSVLFVEVEDLRRKLGGAGEGILEKQWGEAKEVAWKANYQLGKHQDFPDIALRMKLLGQAMLLSPSSQIFTILPLWITLEARLDAEPTSGTNSGTTMSNPLLFLADPQLTISSTLAVEAASRTFSRAAAFFPQAFRSTSPHVSPNPSSLSPSLGTHDESIGGGMRSISPGSRTGLGVRDGAAVLGAGISSRLTKGVGWLIGADAAEHQRGGR